jgi:hypothetical protein
MSTASRAFTIGTLQFGSYFIITLNMRAVVEFDYLTTAITDVFLAWIAFSTVKRIVAATTGPEMLCYVVGGVLGAQCALLWSQYGDYAGTLLRLVFLGVVSK